MKKVFFIISLCVVFTSFSQEEKKSITITKTQNAPKIDGVLDDDVWKNTEVATNFTQFRPDMGVTLPEHQKTTVRVAYDDNAVYFAAYLKDNPDNIQRQLTSRDNFGNSDFFGVILNPNNDGQNDVEFFVFASGTQADAVSNPSSGEDFGWSAVWDSAVKIVDDGWIVEMKIPYRALRFSKDVNTWGLQFHRRFRVDNTQYSWNPIDRTKGNIGLYNGELVGIKDIDPPVRLNFYPFSSAIFNNEKSPEYKLGLDVKYGITENFTLDATLIPDFSQASFDNVRLNLGPFEQTFGEQRQFFKEGVDLFNKGNLFFSRRIGAAPRGSISLNSDEYVDDVPDNVNVINAIKVSGRTKKGLGIGVFNAVTEKTEATIRNRDTNESRREVIEPLTNYNIIVVDQQFNGNSSIGIVNTSVWRNGSNFRDAYTGAIVANINNKRNTYNIRAEAKVSQPNFDINGPFGFNSFFRVGKSHGKFRYSFDHSFSNDKFDINDLGLNFRNNFNNFGIDVNYRIFEPTEKLNNFFVNFYVNHQRLYKPSTETHTNLGININGQNKKLMWFGGNIRFEAGNQYDYFEPRDFTNKRYFVYKNIGSVSGWLDTNSNKRLAVNLGGGMWHAFDKERDLFGYWIDVSPSFRMNDKFRVNYGFEYNNNKGSRGFANRSNSIDDEIVFGERDVLTIENSIAGSYTFNPFHTVALTFRNYWSRVTYDQNPYFLQEDGSVIEQSETYEELGLDSSNVNFSTWNLDLSYTWQVAPGSFLTALYRNQLFHSTGDSQATYFDSLDTLFDQDMNHIFSLRLQYFIDYNSIKGIFKRKSNNSMQAQTRPVDYIKRMPYEFGRP